MSAAGAVRRIVGCVTLVALVLLVAWAEDDMGSLPWWHGYLTGAVAALVVLLLAPPEAP